MGLVLGFAILVGVVIGLVVTAVTGGLAVVITIRGAKRRLYVWRVVAVVAAIFVGVLAILVQHYANRPVRPGSDYDIVTENFFVSGFGYSATPGIAAFVAALVSLRCPKRPLADTRESNT
ncbi:hypothetical protein LCGC14_1180230 [marine sediment metagenome]|uniref:Uncharacterized protein n=1 Tax=marine sediment metagenome TaxID=412755 RepID=A0A0F9LS56_9ZZZZ